MIRTQIKQQSLILQCSVGTSNGNFERINVNLKGLMRLLALLCPIRKTSESCSGSHSGHFGVKFEKKHMAPGHFYTYKENNKECASDRNHRINGFDLQFCKIDLGCSNIRFFFSHNIYVMGHLFSRPWVCRGLVLEFRNSTPPRPQELRYCCYCCCCFVPRLN